MRWRTLGNSGLQVTSVSLGSWLTYGGSVGDDEAAKCIDRAWELGVRFFDTADVYAGGRAEEVVGRALRSRERSSYVLATKLFWPMGETPNERGLSRKHVIEGCHASLRRLRHDHVDLLQCHRADPETPLEETCRAMDDLVRAGDVLYWGVSEWPADRIAAAVEVCRSAGWTLPISNQPQYSALNRVIEAEVLPVCERDGLGSVVWSPLAMGVLTGKYRSADDLPEGSRAASGSGVSREYLAQPVLDAVAALRPVAEEAGCTLAQLALAWCLRLPAITSVIVGASRPEQLDETCAAADIDLSPAAVDAVDRILGPHAVRG